MSRSTKLVRRFARRFNRGRYERVMAMLEVKPTDRILELGCGRGAHSIARYNRLNEIVGIDVHPPDRVVVAQPNFSYRQGDAANLAGIGDGEFEIALSFGMLEHIQPHERMIDAIHEAQRVSSRYCFVVPHRYAFVEPHYLLPLFPLWPDRLKSWLIRRFGLGSQRRDLAGEWQRIHWLSSREWQACFADPNLRIVAHWYGPIQLDYLIFGGRGFAP